MTLSIDCYESTQIKSLLKKKQKTTIKIDLIIHDWPGTIFRL